MQSVIRKSLRVSMKPAAIQNQVRYMTTHHGDGTLGKSDKAAFLLEDLRKARDLIEDIQREHAETKVVFHEAHKSLQSALQQSHNDMKDLITSQTQSHGENVESLRQEVGELKKLLKELLEKKQSN